MNQQSEHMYQGYQRSKYLGLLRRLCLERYRDDLLQQLCSSGINKGQCEAVVTQWIQILCAEIETQIRNSDTTNNIASGAMTLLYDIPGQSQLLLNAAHDLCDAYHGENNTRLNGILWTILSQHFKEKMDQLDAAGGGKGTHQLQVTRRIEQLIHHLQEQRGSAFQTMPELASALHQEIQQQKLNNMPTTISKIMEYLYAIDARFQVELDDDAQHVDLIATHIAHPELMLQLQQCLQQLKPELSQALNIKFELGSEPVFLKEADFKAHYGFGKEALRKRASKGLTQLLECLNLQGE